MIYFDNSATTKVDEGVLESFINTTRKFYANPNSLHKLGLESKKIMTKATEQVANLLKVKKEEVIFTSSSSESNNLAIKGVLNFYPKRPRIVLTTVLEHPSISVTLAHENVKIINLKLDENYHIDLTDLKEKLKLDPVLVSIHHVNSELGVTQDINTIGKIIKENSKAIFHVDGTQSLAKIPVDLTYVDLFSASAHKFYGIKGVAVLIKKEKIGLTPLISGGASQTTYRAGTPAVPLIVSFAKALRLALEQAPEALKKVTEINNYLQEELKKIKNITINSKDDASPYILNFSVKGQKPETLIHELEAKDIILSTKTACSSKEDYSKAIYELTNDKELSQTSLRLSLSKNNTIEEAKEFIKILKEEIL